MTSLDLSDLTVWLHEEDDVEVALVRELSVSVEAGETLCIVGESGSGKTVTAMSIIRLLEFTAPVETSGAIALAGVDLTRLDAEHMRRYRGSRIAMIFQEALDSLNPSQRIGAQLVEGYHPDDRADGRSRRRGPADRREALDRARALLTEVGLSDTERILALYPHQLSGGMQQRVMIALALMSNPDVLIADEPTTALDVTTQADILTMFRRVQRDHGTACVFITHDMAVAAEIADRIAVVYAGRLVEVGATRDILSSPAHRYTRALLECVPRLGVRQTDGLPSIRGSVPAPSAEMAGCRFAPRCAFSVERCRTELPPLIPQEGRASLAACWNPGRGPVTVAAGDAAPEAAREPEATVLTVDHVTKTFSARGRGLRRAPVVAVDDVSFDIARGEFFGLVGESGSGKTTLGRIVTALERPDAGEIVVGDHRYTAAGLAGPERAFRRRVQPVFQDPLASLDPRHTVARIVAEPLRELGRLSRREAADRVATLVEEVGLPTSVLSRTAGQLSGGQRQRVAIARAIAPEPDLIVADEPTSALDVSVQGQVINLLLDLRRRRGLSFLFITHNLSLILSVADRVGVMQSGRLLELGTPDEVTNAPRHDYTRRLLAANPVLPDDDG